MIQKASQCLFPAIPSTPVKAYFQEESANLAPESKSYTLQIVTYRHVHSYLPCESYFTRLIKLHSNYFTDPEYQLQLNPNI